MAKLSLTKGALAKERSQLKLYDKLLPSLELKRRQLTLERDRAKSQLTAMLVHKPELQRQVSKRIPMLANHEIDLTGLVKVRSANVIWENVVGTQLPTLDRVDVAIGAYSYLSKPAWVDAVVQQLVAALKLELEVQVQSQRVKILNQAVRRVTQRVNLFERVLIPTAKKNIARIQIYLGDRERDAVVRSKIAKKKGARTTPPGNTTAAGRSR